MKLLTPEAMERGDRRAAPLPPDRRHRRRADPGGGHQRDAGGREPREFLERARDEAGVELEVISGIEEARLIHLGVLQALPVFDQATAPVRHRRRLDRAGARPSGRGAGLAQLQARRGPADQPLLRRRTVARAPTSPRAARSSARWSPPSARRSRPTASRWRSAPRARSRRWPRWSRPRPASRHCGRSTASRFTRTSSRRSSRPSPSARTERERSRHRGPRRQAGRHHPRRRAHPRGRRRHGLGEGDDLQRLRAAGGRAARHHPADPRRRPPPPARRVPPQRARLRGRLCDEEPDHSAHVAQPGRRAVRRHRAAARPRPGPARVPRGRRAAGQRGPVHLPQPAPPPLVLRDPQLRAC